MERQLTDKQISELCSYMRIIDLMNANPDKLDQEPKLKETMDLFSEKVRQIMEQLSDEECDEILEIHREQLQEIERMAAIKEAKKQKKKLPKAKED
jgi:SpoVK/Ycf46/Vps4 family AAA+-type ATPase